MRFKTALGITIGLVFAMLACALLWQTQSPRIIGILDSVTGTDTLYTLQRKHKISLQLLRLQLGDAPEFILLGDSHIERVCPNCLPGFVNLGISGETSYGLLQRWPAISEQVATNACIVLGVGFNDLGAQYNTRTHMDNLFKQLTAYRILHLGVVPVAPKLRNRYQLPIDNLNRHLAVQCESSSKCFNVPSTALRSAANIHEPDGVHLNPSGYNLWLATIEHYAQLHCGWLTINPTPT